jgi:RimJ/RimL family protein N-acetyltransferase
MTGGTNSQPLPLPGREPGDRLPRPAVLERDDVRLEPLSFEHAERLTVALSDAEVFEWLQYQRPITVADTTALIAAALEQEAAGRRRPFAICVDDHAIGTSSFLDYDLFTSGIEIGATFIGKPWWRSHVNSTAKLLLLTYAFETCGYERVMLKTDIANQRSVKAISRLGATHEGTLRHHVARNDGTWRDTVMFSIVSAEWPQIKVNLERALAAKRAES